MKDFPDKLIVVGMRFRSIADNEYLRSVIPIINNPSCKKPHVVIEHEFNLDGVNNSAYKIVLDGYHIGYIRNQDVPQYDAAAAITLKGYGPQYCITKYTPNYLILNKVVESSIYVNGAFILGNSDGTQSKVATTEYVNKQTKDKEMNIQSSMRDQFFREVKHVAIDIQSGKFGVVSQDGISVYQDGGIHVNPIQEFSVKIPAYAMRVAIDNLQEGDILVQGSSAQFFKQKTEQGYEIVTLDGEVKQVGQVTNLFFGKNTVLAVKNMFGDQTQNPMLMAMMMGEGKDFDMKTFALMSMMGGKQMDQSQMMMMMLMAK